MGFLGRVMFPKGSVGARYTNREIRKDLGDRKLIPQRFLAIHRLNGLSEVQFLGLKSLVDKLRAQNNVSSNLKLLLPAAKDLREVDFDRLLNHPKAMDTVYNSCFLKQGFEVDLRKLDVIYARDVLHRVKPSEHVTPEE